MYRVRPDPISRKSVENLAQKSLGKRLDSPSLLSTTLLIMFKLLLITFLVNIILSPANGWSFEPIPADLIEDVLKEPAPASSQDVPIKDMPSESSAVNPEDEASLSMFDSAKKLDDGRKSYEMIRSESDKYGMCWTTAVQSLHVGCKSLNDDSMARMGLSFANCFLEKVGSETYPCLSREDIKACVRSMDDRAFGTYTHFYTHTQSICFFLANQMWQEKTEGVIHRLSSTSEKVAIKMNKMNQLQEETIRSHVTLNEEMMGSRLVLEDFSKKLEEKQNIEMDILNRFMEVKNFLLSEVSKFYSFGFYLGSLIVAFLMTTPTRTSSARFWVFLLMALNLGFENSITTRFLSQTVTGGMNAASLDMDNQVWACRKIMCFLAFIVICWFGLLYKDFSLLNNQLLGEIRQHSLEIKQMQLVGLMRDSQTNTSMLAGGWSPHSSKLLTVPEMSEDDSDYAPHLDHESGVSSEDDSADEGFEVLPRASTPNFNSILVAATRRLDFSQQDVITTIKKSSSPTPNSYNLRPRRSQTPEVATSFRRSSSFSGRKSSFCFTPKKERD